MLKKRWIIALASILVLSSSICTMASEDNSELQQDPFDKMLDNMDSDIYGGAYVNDDGEICITAVDQTAVQGILSRARGVNANEFVIEPVKYSWSDLEKARDGLFNQADNLNITAVGLNPSINGLTVYLDEASDKIKEIILEASSVPNINFIENNSSSSEPIEDVDSFKPEAASFSSIFGGQYLLKKPGEYWSSVGYRAKVGTQTGYITAAHGYTNGAAVYLSDASKLGNISKYSLTTTADACFIPSNIPWTGLKSGIKATGSGNPLVGENIIFDGARHYEGTNPPGTVHAKIQAVDVIGSTDLGGPFVDAFTFDAQPWHGDSGAAVLSQVNGKNKYKLVGFVMSQHRIAGDTTSGNFPWGAACKWNNVKNALGCTFTN